MEAYHIPVLLEESISALEIKEDGTYIDATFGGGGHSREILRRLGKRGRLISFDRDADAIANAPEDERHILVHNNFRFVRNFVEYLGIGEVDGILADLGVSSHQFDTSERGFSFRFDTELDMRMNRATSISAKEIVNNRTAEELAEIFSLYGEVQKSRAAAKMICDARAKSPISSTAELNAALSRLYNPNTEHKFLAQIYQALRIEVNAEMRALEDFLMGCGPILKSGGRLSIITYHSLEDRMVKNYMKSGNTSGNVEKDLYGNNLSCYKIITGKPILPTEEEISGNTRSRSAKLRVAQKR